MSGNRTKHGMRVARAVLAVAVLSCLCASSATANVVRPLSWELPSSVDPTSGLTTITCPTSLLCVAADTAGNVLTSTDPGGGAKTWSLAKVDSERDCGLHETELCYLEHISCPSRSFCVATGGYGVFTSTDPTGGVGAWKSATIDAGYDHTLQGVSCASESLCVAIDFYGDAIISTDPTAGAGAWHTVPIDSGPCFTSDCEFGFQGLRPLDSISCPSVSLCVAGDFDGDVVTTTDPTGGSSAWSVTHVDSHLLSEPISTGIQTPIEDVSCPSLSTCIADDWLGYVLISQDPAGGPPAWKVSSAASPVEAAPEPPSLLSMVCRTMSFCAGVSEVRATLPYPEVALSYDPQAPQTWTRTVVDPVGELESISCPGPSLCAAVDNKGNVVVGRALRPTRARIPALLAAQIGPPYESLGIGSLVSERGFSQRLNPLVHGRLHIRWLLHRPALGVHSIVVAQGNEELPEGKSATIRITLTKPGAAILRQSSGPLKLKAEATFSSPHGRPITVSRAFTVAL
jgi:hypothetical protein